MNFICFQVQLATEQMFSPLQFWSLTPELYLYIVSGSEHLSCVF